MNAGGSCQNLEKYYTRLTVPPNPKLIRPLNTLQSHFSNILTIYDSVMNYEKNGITQDPDIKNMSLRNTISSCRTYNYICSQLQGLRQDLTVQQISNPFTINVYETNARIALQHHDWNQFNLCQTRLMDLYELLPSQNKEEFISLRIIYYLVLLLTSSTRQYDFESMNIQNLLRCLTIEQRQNIFIKISQEIVSAIVSKNFYLFFKIYRSCSTKYQNYLIEPLVPLVRYDALKIILKAYSPSIDIYFVLKALSINDIIIGKKWLVNCGCMLNDIQTNILKRGTNLTNFIYLE